MDVVYYNKLPENMRTVLRGANVFFSDEYGDFLHSKGDKLFFVFDAERIIPIRLRKKIVFTWAVLLSEPFSFVSEPQKSLEEYLDAVIATLEKKLKIRWAISTASCLFDDTPRKKCLRIPFGSHIVDLSREEDELWSKIHSKHRNVIRKAKKDGVTIQKGGLELIDDYTRLDKETWERSGLSCPEKKYYSQQVLTLKNKIEIFIAYKDSIPQAGAIFYYSQAMCYYMFGCSSNNSYTGSANLLQWEAMLEMKKNGVEAFSFVGCRINEDEDSKYHGIQRFKERFGGELREGYMFRVVSRPFYYKMFCVGMQIRNKSHQPYQDAIDEEIGKWRSIQKEK